MNNAPRLFALFIVIAVIVTLSYAQSPSDCKQSCKDDYDRVVATAQSYFDASYFNQETCSDVAAARAGAASTCLVTAFGRPDGGPGYPGIAGCFDTSTDDAGMQACGAALQRCCLQKGKDNAQIWYDECMAGCPTLCTGITCDQIRCDGENISRDGTCDNNTGNCVYVPIEHCDYGCNYTSFTCNPKPSTPKCEPCKNQYDTQLDNYPDCTCVPTPCQEKCDEGMTQKPYPDCSCVAKDLCTNADGSKKTCDDTCEKGTIRIAKNTGKPTQTEFDHAIGSGTCNPDTGQCEYTVNDTCTMGCAMNGKKSYCNEDCDNGVIDDKIANQLDCANPSCASSVYCNCTKIGEYIPHPDRKVLTIIVGSTDFLDTTPFYNYNNRDADARSTGQSVYDALKAAPPLSDLNYIVYVTRLPGHGADAGITRVYSVGYSSMRTRCTATGGPSGDFTFFVDETDQGFDSYSKLNSWTSTLFKKRMVKEDFPNVIVHEFGHGFGGLWDEYITNIVDIAETFLPGKDVNCASVGPANELDCKKYFSQYTTNFQCIPGCTSGVAYRSSQDSVMFDPTTSGQFNDVSKVIVQNKINEFYGISANAMLNPPQPWKPKTQGLAGWR